MNNFEILKSVLSFANENDEQYWDNLFRNKEDNILWYLSAGRDFRDLLFFHPSYLKQEIYPQLFVHTDFLDYYKKDIKGNILYEDKKTKISIENKININFNNEFHYFTDPRIVELKPSSPKVSLMELKIESDVLGTFYRPLLYFIIENNNFFEEIILKKHLSISHLVTIRVGAGLGGGGRINFRYIEFFLGLIGTKYIASDNYGRDIIGFNIIFRHPILRDAYFSDVNKPYILKFLKEIHWSNYGIFQGDAFVAEVLSYPNNPMRKRFEQ